MDPRVLLDTCIWVDALRGGKPDIVAAVRRLLATDRVVRCDVVTAELRAGLRTSARRTVLDLLEAIPNLAVDSSDWEAAGDLGADLRRTGVSLPLPDLLIARVCLRHDLQLFTRDGHFRAIEGLRLRE